MWRLSVAVVWQLFADHVSSQFGDIYWPPRSPDLTVCISFLRDYFKSKVYDSRTTTTAELKRRIQEEFDAISVEFLCPQFEERICENGYHLTNIVFRNWYFFVLKWLIPCNLPSIVKKKLYFLTFVGVISNFSVFPATCRYSFRLLFFVHSLLLIALIPIFTVLPYF